MTVGNSCHTLIMAQVLHMDPGFPGATFTNIITNNYFY